MEEGDVQAQPESSAGTASAKELLSKQWHWARESVHKKLSGAQMFENICDMHKQESLQVIVERLIRGNPYEFTEGLGRFV